MTTALATIARSLYDIEQELDAFVETESLVTSEQEDEFAVELARALQASIEKRDRVGQFIRHCELQADNCDIEIKRLQERKRTYQLAEKRMRLYVQHVIESLGPDTKGRPKKLEGKAITFSLRAKPAAVEIIDEQLIPAEYKAISLTLPLELWQTLCDEVCNDDEEDPLWSDVKRATEKATCSVTKAAVKAAIDRGEEVPGADLSIGGYSLIVK